MRTRTTQVKQPRAPSFGLEDLALLEWLVDFELRGAARYRRFATLVMITAPESAVELIDFLADSIRGSDAVFHFESSAAILMGETDPSGAMAAVMRFKSRCDETIDLRFAVASYPSDGRDATTLLSALQRRRQEAVQGGFGAVVDLG